jgi:hypothetical protein
MREYLSAFYEGSTEISPDEIIGALAIGLALAMACSGLCLLGRKRSSNVFPVFCGLIFGVSVISMVVGIGHARFKYMGSGKHTTSAHPIHNGSPFFNGRPPLGWPGPPPGGHPPRHFLGRTLLHEADANKDGQLTPEEAAQYIREVDSGGRGWVNAQEIDQTLRHRDAPPAVGEHRPEPPTAPELNPRIPERPDSPE